MRRSKHVRVPSTKPKSPGSRRAVFAIALLAAGAIAVACATGADDGTAEPGLGDGTPEGGAQADGPAPHDAPSDVAPDALLDGGGPDGAGDSGTAHDAADGGVPTDASDGATDASNDAATAADASDGASAQDATDGGTSIDANDGGVPTDAGDGASPSDASDGAAHTDASDGSAGSCQDGGLGGAGVPPGAVATATSNAMGFQAPNAIDGDVTSLWSPGNTPPVGTLTLTLPAATQLNGVRAIIGGDASYTVKFDVTAYLGGTALATGSASVVHPGPTGQLVSISLTPGSYDSLQFAGSTNGGAWIGLYEVSLVTQSCP